MLATAFSPARLGGHRIFVVISAFLPSSPAVVTWCEVKVGLNILILDGPGIFEQLLAADTLRYI